jgi:hypothetical protein
MKPFNLQDALAGKQVVTRDGNEVTQLHLFNCPNEKDVLYGVESNYIESWDILGQYRRGGSESGRDLFMAPTERKEWVVRRVRPSGAIASRCFNTKEIAEQVASHYEGATIHEITVVE